MECFNLFQSKGSVARLDMECFNLSSPEGQQLGWVWNALFCSVLRVGGWVGYGML